MSELFDSNTDDSELFAALETSHMDPVVRRILDEVGIYNKLLGEEPVVASEVDAVVGELNNRCGNLRGRSAVFTGWATFPDVYQKGEMVSTHYEDEPVEFHGVVGIIDETRNTGSYGDTPLYYCLRVLLHREVIGPDAESLTVGGGAVAEDVMGLEILNMMSPERARSILEEMCPDLLEDIDVAVLNDGLEEADIAMHLAGLQYDAANYGHDEETATQITTALDVYMDTSIQFDEHLGYRLKLDGAMWMFEENGTFRSVSAAGKTLMIAPRLRWLESPEMGHNEKLPHLVGKLHFSEVNSVSDLRGIPLDFVEVLQPLRFLYYAEFGD